VGIRQIQIRKSGPAPAGSRQMQLRVIKLDSEKTDSGKPGVREFTWKFQVISLLLPYDPLEHGTWSVLSTSKS